MKALLPLRGNPIVWRPPADILDEEGRPIRNQVGEFVFKAPWIGMIRGF